MRVRDKILMDKKGLEQNGPITIVALGDSITHGAVACGEINYETVYWNRLKQKINALRNYVPINVINAGIGGVTAYDSLLRISSQVLAHNPDLIIVCFGLNDINGELDLFLTSLEEIFTRCIQSGAETIYMSPNMLNTYVSDDTSSELVEYAKLTAEYQNNGKMDRYITEAIKLAEKCGVTVCDCYSKWKELSKTQDITMLLANRINHPTKAMHKLFADSLFDVIFGDEKPSGIYESTMYNRK